MFGIAFAINNNKIEYENEKGLYSYCYFFLYCL